MVREPFCFMKKFGKVRELYRNLFFCHSVLLGTSSSGFIYELYRKLIFIRQENFTMDQILFENEWPWKCFSKSNCTLPFHGMWHSTLLVKGSFTHCAFLYNSKLNCLEVNNNFQVILQNKSARRDQEHCGPSKYLSDFMCLN